MAITSRYWLRDAKNFTAIAANGGTAQYQFTTNNDTVNFFKATVVMVHSTTGHVDGGAGLVAQYIVENRNGSIVVPAALTLSTNPQNSNTAGLATAMCEASDINSAGGVQPTAVWTNAGTINLTVTNNYTDVVDAMVFVEIFVCSND